MIIDENMDKHVNKCFIYYVVTSKNLHYKKSVNIITKTERDTVAIAVIIHTLIRVYKTCRHIPSVNMYCFRTMILN